MADPTSSSLGAARMRGRTIGLTVVVVAAIAVVIWWQRRERVVGAEPPAVASGSAPAAPGSATPPPETMRKIDTATRQALLDRIRTAREARAGSAASPATTATAPSATPRPSLPPLPGKLEPSAIRAAVHEVIPLLAECYDNALPRLAVKQGKITVNMKLVGEPEVGTLIEHADVAGDEGFTKDPELMECFQQTMMSIELPPTTEGHEVHITYPMTFSPGS